MISKYSIYIKILPYKESISAFCTFMRYYITFYNNRLKVRYFGGGYRSRTDHQSFADSCLTAWLRRHLLLEQVAGIGPANQPWQGCILPLNYTCTICIKDLIIITKDLKFVKTFVINFLNKMYNF